MERRRRAVRPESVLKLGIESSAVAPDGSSWLATAGADTTTESSSATSAAAPASVDEGARTPAVVASAFGGSSERAHGAA